MTIIEFRWTSIFVGAAALISCGGRTVGGNEAAGTAASGAAGAGGIGATGSTSVSSSSGSAGSMQIGVGVGGGSVVGGNAGMAGASVTVNPGSCHSAGSRCPYGPQGEVAPRCPSSTPPSMGTGAAVLSRIATFLENAPSVVPSTAVPAQANAAWAASEATAILDRHIANNEAPPGFARFLSFWLDAKSPALALSDPHGWPLRLAAPGANLHGLLNDVTTDPRRVGILTEQELLAARPGITQRGVWLMRLLLCQDFPAPPASPPPPPPMPPAPGQTRRQYLAGVTANPACYACHSISDPLGSSLEHFDEMGSYRDVDNGQPVDSSGSYQTMFKFASIDDLAQEVSDSCDVARCFAGTMFNAALGVDPHRGDAIPYAEDELNDVASLFADSNFSIRELVKAIVASPTFLR